MIEFILGFFHTGLPTWLFPKILIQLELDVIKIEFLTKIFITKLHVNFFVVYVPQISSTLNFLKSILNLKIIKLGCYTPLHSQIHRLIDFPHRSTTIHPQIRCHLFIISGKKPISKFDAHREFYGIGEKQFQILQRFIIHNVFSYQRRIFI